MIESANSKKPFFIWLTLGSAHAPFGFNLVNRFADPNYEGAFAGIVFFANNQYYYDGWVYDPLKKGFRFRLSFRDQADDLLDRKYLKGPFPKRVGPADLKYVSDSYDNGVAQIDSDIGQLFDFLSEADFVKDTVVVIQSEHGETLGERKYIAHMDIHEELVHVPALIVSPKLSFLSVDQFVSGVDLMPSVLDHLAVPQQQKALDGKSFFTHGPKGVEFKSVRDEIFTTRVPFWDAGLDVDLKPSQFDRLREFKKSSGNDLKDYGLKNQSNRLIHRRSRFAEEMFSAWTYISGKHLSIPEFEFYDIKKDPKELHPLPAKGPEFSKMRDELLLLENKVRGHQAKIPGSDTLQEYR